MDFKLKHKEFQECRNNFLRLEESFLLERKKVREEVHLKVSADFHEEISRLEAIIDRFNEPFFDDVSKISEYKQVFSLEFMMRYSGFPTFLTLFGRGMGKVLAKCVHTFCFFFRNKNNNFIILIILEFGVLCRQISHPRSRG